MKLKGLLQRLTGARRSPGPAAPACALRWLAACELGTARAVSTLEDYGEREAARRLGQRLKEHSPADSAPAAGDEAIRLYREGRWEQADEIMSRLDRQLALGEPESAAAAAAYLDAHRLRIAAFFDRNASIFPATVAKDDGRAKFLLSAVRAGDRVLEVGCGKGRFLKVILGERPGCRCTGVDVSKALLREVPPAIQTLLGSMESVPLPDATFDVVFLIEAIEHSANPAAAVRELARVARPGGIVIVIDKQESQWGRLECPSWERWPGRRELTKLLEGYCDEVVAEPVGYDGRPASDELMVAWKGRRGAGESGRS